MRQAPAAGLAAAAVPCQLRGSCSGGTQNIWMMRAFVEGCEHVCSLRLASGGSGPPWAPQAPWLLMIETDYVWMKPVAAPMAESKDLSIAFPFGYIQPTAAMLEVRPHPPPRHCPAGLPTAACLSATVQSAVADSRSSCGDARCIPLWASSLPGVCYRHSLPGDSSHWRVVAGRDAADVPGGAGPADGRAQLGPGARTHAVERAVQGRRLPPAYCKNLRPPLAHAKVAFTTDAGSWRRRRCVSAARLPTCEPLCWVARRSVRSGRG